MTRWSASALVATSIALLAVGATPAAAATRYVSPSGTGAAPCTDQALPCNIGLALNGPSAVAADGDTVMMLTGAAGEFYTVTTGAPIDIRHNVRIGGDPAGPRPLIKVDSSAGSTSAFTFESDAAGSTVNHLAFEEKGFYPVTALGRTDFSDVSAQGRGCLELRGANSSVVDSTLEQTLPSGMTAEPCLFVGANGVQVRHVDINSVKESSSSLDVAAAQLFGAGIHFDGIRIRSETMAMSVAGDPADPAVIRRADLSGSGYGVSTSPGVVLTDTLVHMNGAGARAVIAQGGILRNVTAVAAGADSYGLYLRSSGGSGTTTNVRNSILRGDGKDVALQPTVPASGTPACNPATNPGCVPYFPPQPAGTLVIGNSNYRSAQVGDGGTLTDAGGNSTADPLFAGAADFHLRSGSPAIDAGADDALNGPLDLDGKVRKLGAAPDMGAYESDPPPPSGGGVADTIAPRLTALGITNKVFTVGSDPTPVRLARAKAKKGTTFVFTSSEAGTATITISRAARGRRRGRQCVKTTKKNRKARKCTRYTAARPPLTRRAVAGPNAVPFSGRIGTKALKPGSYRATIVVADAAGNRSQAKSIGFKVVKK